MSKSKTRKMKGGAYPMDWNNYSDRDKDTYCALNYTSIRQKGFFGKKGGYHLENGQCIKNADVIGGKRFRKSKTRRRKH